MAEDSEIRRKKTIEKMESARKNYIEIKEDIGRARENLADMDLNVTRAICDLDRALPVYRLIPGGTGIGHNSTYANLVNSGYHAADKMYGHSVGLKHLTERMYGNMAGGAFSTLATTAASGNMCTIARETGVAALKAYGDNMPLQEAVKQAQKPNPIEAREAFAEKLRSIEPRLATKFQGMWQTLFDATKKDRFRQAASSMREVLSDFEHILAPDDEVKKANWWKVEVESGRPTQRQRVKYAIIGSEQQKIVSDHDVELITALMDIARDTYKDLNKATHAREEDAEEVFPLLESYIEICQVNMTKILEMRDKFFKDTTF